MRRAKVGRADQGGPNAGQRTLRAVVGQNLAAKAGKAAGITIGRNQHPFDLRLQPVKHMGNQRTPPQQDHGLVGPAHASRFAPGKDHSEDAQA